MLHCFKCFLCRFMVTGFHFGQLTRATVYPTAFVIVNSLTQGLLSRLFPLVIPYPLGLLIQLARAAVYFRVLHLGLFCWLALPGVGQHRSSPRCARRFLCPHLYWPRLCPEQFVENAYLNKSGYEEHRLIAIFPHT